MRSDHIATLNAATVKMINTIFSQNYDVTDIVTTESVPSFKCRFLIQIGMRNREYQCMIILGTPAETAEVLLKEIYSLTEVESERTELAKSAMGELSNSIACDIAADQRLVEDYGKLLPTPPLVWVVDGRPPDFIPADGLSGVLVSGDKKIFTHFSAAKNVVGKDGQSWSPTQSLSIYNPHHDN